MMVEYIKFWVSHSSMLLHQIRWQKIRRDNDTFFAPKIGTKPIRLTPAIIPVS
jgi:hypothetical protein